MHLVKMAGAALVLFFSASAVADPLPIDQYRNQILSAELEGLIAPRLASARKCGLKELSSEVLEQSLRDSRDPSLPPHQRSLLLLDLDQKLLQAESAASPCAQALRAARLQEERRARAKFEKAFVLTQLLTRPGRVSPSSRLLLELDPHCAIRVQADWGGAKDGNPCFAGAQIVLAHAFANGADRALDEAQNRFESLRVRVIGSPAGVVIDLAEAMGGAEEAVRWLALATTSSTSANGYVDGYGLPILRQAAREGGDALTAYKRYMRLKNLADTARAFQAGVVKRGLRMTLLGTDVTGWNRHNWMSAVLSLHYRDAGKAFLARELPVLLGTLYESRDAASHLREGQSARETWQGFRQDRKRYIDGVRLARRIRSPGPEVRRYP